MEIECLSSTHLNSKSVKKNVAVVSSVKIEFPDAPLNIVNLNDDCLEAIFMNLTLKDLFHVIVTHTCFLTACRRIFVHKFKHKELTLSAFQTTYFEYPMVLSLLGDIVTCLRITYHRSAEYKYIDHQLHNTIIRYCSDTLTVATFNHIQSTMHINQQFQSLRKLHFNQGCVGQTMSNFNKWFPKLTNLQLFFCKTINKQCIEETFPNLKHFTVAHHNFTFNNLRTFLDLNPQLVTFTVYSYDHQLISQLDTYTRLQFKSLTTKFETYPCYFAFNNN